MTFVHAPTGQVELFKLPDSLDFDVEGFNRTVITEPFNRAVADELTRHIDLTEDDKTLVFAASDAHADIVVKALRDAFREAHGDIEDAAIRKLTGSVDKVGKLILSYRNDALPKIAVTVDLLTTGVDIPKITNLVFLRRVNSRILYEQMLGRATRLCPEIGKETFRIFDAVDLYSKLQDMTEMRPVPDDWYAVFKAATKFRHVEMEALRADPKIGPRVGGRSPAPIATIAEVKAAGIPIVGNPNKFGIPQGTPISAALSNLYMHPLDAKLHAACSKVGALYRRYSDDLLIICPPDAEADLVAALKAEIAAQKLKLNDDKTERVVFDGTNPNAFQYLGFIVSQDDAGLRSASLARQWRKAKRSIRRTERAGVAAREAGTATKTFTKKLRRRFLPSGVRNFSSYARRSADAFGSKTMVRQVLRLERMVEKAIKRME